MTSVSPCRVPVKSTSFFLSPDDPSVDSISCEEYHGAFDFLINSKFSVHCAVSVIDQRNLWKLQLLPCKIYQKEERLIKIVLTKVSKFMQIDTKILKAGWLEPKINDFSLPWILMNFD